MPQVVRASAPPAKLGESKPAERHIVVRFHSFQTEYMVHEPINIMWWVENTSDSVEYYYPEEVMYLELRNERGEQTDICYPRGKAFVAGPEYVAVPPRGTSIKGVENMLRLFGQNRNILGCDLPVGTYVLRSSYQASDSLVIKVVGPDNDRDRTASELVESHLLREGRSAGIAPLEIYRFCKEYASQLDNSRLAAWRLRTLFLLRVTNVYDDPSEEMNYAVRLITEFPDDWAAHGSVLVLHVSAISASERAKIKEGLAIFTNKFHGTFEAECAEELLEQMRD